MPRQYHKKKLAWLDLAGREPSRDAALDQVLHEILRQDAAERTFRSALSQIPCLSSTPHSLRVKAGPHPVHGTLITIFLTRPEPLDRTTLVAAIEELMSRYSFAYVVTASGE